MMKALFLSMNILVASLGYVSPLLDVDVDTVESRNGKYIRYEVVSAKGIKGVWLEGVEDKYDTVYLIEDDFSSTLSVGDRISISYDEYNDIEDILEDVDDLSIY